MQIDTAKLRLYVASEGPNSQQAIANLTALCERYLPNQHAIEVVDLAEDPARALADGILLTPTLVILSAEPIRTIVGNLASPEPILRALGVSAQTQ